MYVYIGPIRVRLRRCRSTRFASQKTGDFENIIVFLLPINYVGLLLGVGVSSVRFWTDELFGYFSISPVNAVSAHFRCCYYFFLTVFPDLPRYKTRSPVK